MCKNVGCVSWIILSEKKKKKARLKRLPTEWFFLYDIVEKAKLWRQNTDRCRDCLGTAKGPREFLGYWRCSWFVVMGTWPYVGQKSYNCVINGEFYCKLYLSKLYLKALSSRSVFSPSLIFNKAAFNN